MAIHLRHEQATLARLGLLPSGRLSLTLIDPLRSQWESSHLLDRGHDRKAKSLEAYLNDIMVAILTGAAIVRHNRIAAEIASIGGRKLEAHLREQERRRYEAQVDAFIEGKADELARLQKILSFRDYVSRQYTDAASREQDPTFRAASDLVERLQRSLSVDAVGQAFGAQAHGRG